MNDTPQTPNPIIPVPSPQSLASEPTAWQRFWAFPVTRIVLYVLAFALIDVLLSLPLLGVLKLLHHHKGHNAAVLQPVSEGLTAASATLAFWVMVRFVDKRPWATAGFGRRGLPELGGGFLLGAGLLAVGIGIYAALGEYRISAVTPGALVLVPLALYLCVGVFEETFFRGYLFQTLEGRWGSGVALGASSLIFGLLHLINPTPGLTPLQHLRGPLFLCLEAGLPLGAAYLLTRRWWLPIGIHWAWDYFEGPIFGCPDSGTHDPHTLLHAVFTGSVLLTGGAFGPEAGIVFLLTCTTLGVFLLRAAVKKGNWKPLRGGDEAPEPVLDGVTPGVWPPPPAA